MYEFLLFRKKNVFYGSFRQFFINISVNYVPILEKFETTESPTLSECFGALGAAETKKNDKSCGSIGQAAPHSGFGKMLQKPFKLSDMH